MDAYFVGKAPHHGLLVSHMLETALTAFTTFFAVIGPIDSAVLVASLTPNATKSERRAISLKAVAIATLIVLAFALFGQPLLNQLQTVEKALDPYRREDADARVWPSPQERRKCQVIAERANALLGELLQLERQSETAVVENRDRTSRELATATSALAARQAYVSTPAAISHGIDFSLEG